ncbi:unnamed protein product [Effrenium voratum]|nr:unnamed protein product [Effrenium voratum]|mmetsp:Transcript_26481/g.63190  ORF Transcript_26481/g.63190 Transcript_26481/m.63190 type:complete len:122 (+) Transcript_26481:31-396(+)
MGNVAICCAEEKGQECDHETMVAEVAIREDPGFTTAPLVITFLLPDGVSTRDVWFYESPLGLDFSMRLPMRVKAVKPGFIGAHSKVQIGWTILRIDGKPVPGSFDAALMMLQTRLQSMKRR